MGMNELINMTEEKKPVVKGKRPNFKGDGCAAWINKDKNGNIYLSVVLLNSIKVNLFENKLKAEE